MEKKQQKHQKFIQLSLTVVPSTLAEDLAPKVPLATAVPMTSSTTSTTESSTTAAQPTDEVSKLGKAMEENVT